MWNHFLAHLIHGARHEKEHPKLMGVVLIIVGIITAPMLIGIPIMLYGFYKLCS
jgi:hypothetical protein